MNSAAYRPDVDGLRGIAVALVVLFHLGIEKVFLQAGLGWGGGGFIGVDVFFVLSGYLIIGQLVREHEVTGRIGLVAFYARRIRRLLPLATITLLLTQVVALVVLPTVEWSRIARDVAAAALFLANFHFAAEARTYSASDVDESPVLHFWSLSVEEQAYLFLPGFLFLVLRAWSRRVPRDPSVTRIRACASMLFVAISSLLISESGAETGDSWSYYATHGRLFELALGGVVASAEPFIPRGAVRRLAGVLGLAGLLGVLGPALLYSRATPFPGLAALVPCVATTLVLVVGGVAPMTFTARAVGVPPLRFLGRISYAWYLVHWPFLVFAGPITFRERAPSSHLAVAAALSLVFAALLHHLIERPARHSARLIQGAAPLALLVASVATTLAVTAVMQRAAERRSDGVMSPLEARLDRPRLLPSGCDQDFFDTDDEPCLFGDLLSPVPDVVLLGDSHAAHLIPAFDAALRAERRSGWLFTKATCPPLDVRRTLPAYGREYWECAVWREAVVEKVEMLRPSLLVLARMGTYESSLVNGDGVRLDGAAALREWETGTRKQYERLFPLVERMLVVRDTPRLPYDGPRCLAGPTPEACTIPPSAIYWDADLHAGEVAAAEGLEITVLDLNPTICPPGPECLLVDAGVIKLRDSNHLTATYAAQLAPLVARAVAAVPLTSPDAPP